MTKLVLYATNDLRKAQGERDLLLVEGTKSLSKGLTSLFKQQRLVVAVKSPDDLSNKLVADLLSRRYLIVAYETQGQLVRLAVLNQRVLSRETRIHNQGAHGQGMTLRFEYYYGCFDLSDDGVAQLVQDNQGQFVVNDIKKAFEAINQPPVKMPDDVYEAIAMYSGTHEQSIDQLTQYIKYALEVLQTGQIPNDFLPDPGVKCAAKQS